MDQSDLEDWADFYSLTFPVLQDTSALVDRVYDPMARTRPTYVLLAPGAEIVSMGVTVSDAAIEATLPTAYP